MQRLRGRYWVWLLGLWVALLPVSTAARGGFDASHYHGRVGGQHFTTYFNTTGPEAVAQADAEAVAQAMEDAYDRLVNIGHLRPLCVQPEPVVVGVDNTTLGGENVSEGMYFREWIYVNARAGDWTTLRATTAHELFHSLQWNYMIRGLAPADDWVIEGTAPVAAYLAFRDDPATARSLLTSHLAWYWKSHSAGLKTQTYATSLFWYDLASRYGGLRFFDRFFELGGQYSWEQALQYAVLEKGGPDDTTFDTLFRAFMLRVATGAINLNYPRGYGVLWPDDQIVFRGKPLVRSVGSVLGGFTPDGASFAYYPPLQVEPWSFKVVDLIGVGEGLRVPVRVRLGGAPDVELYALVQDSDGVWQGVRADSGSLVLPALSPGSHVRLLVARMGGPRGSRYSLQVERAEDAADPLQPLTSLTYDPPGGPRDGMPPALTPDQLEQLRAGVLLPPPVRLAEVPVSLSFRPGQTSYGTPDGSKLLPVAPQQADMTLLVPVDMAPDLGATLELLGRQVRVTYQGVTYTLDVGSSVVRVSDGTSFWLTHAPVAAGRTVLIPLDFWSNLPFQTNSVRGPDGDFTWVVAAMPTGASSESRCRAWGPSVAQGGGR